MPQILKDATKQALLSVEEGAFLLTLDNSEIELNRALFGLAIRAQQLLAALESDYGISPLKFLQSMSDRLTEPQEAK